MATENRTKYLIKNTAIFAVGTVATKLINFVLVPLYTYVLTTQEYGTIDLITNICMVLSPILILNIGESVMRFSLYKDANHEQILSVGILCLATSCVAGLLIFPIGSHFEIINDFRLELYLYTIAAGFSQVFLCYLRGKEKLVAYSFCNIINTLGIAGLNILFVAVMKRGTKGFLSAYIISNFMTALLAAVYGHVLQGIRHFSFQSKLAINMIKYSVVLIPNVFMWWLMTSADHIIVTAVLGAAANGIFAISYKIPSILSAVVSIFNQAWSYSAIKENDSVDRDEYTNQIYAILFMVITILGAAMLVVLKPFLHLYVSEAYYIAWYYAPPLVLGFVFQSLGTFMSTPYTVNLDSKGFLVSASLGAIVNIALNIFFVFKLGIFGVAIATATSYIVVYLYRCYDTHKYVKISIFDKRYISVIVVLLAMFATVYITNWVGEIVLLAESGIIIALQRKIWQPMLETLLKKIKHTD